MKVEPAGLRIRPWGMRSALKDIGDLTDDLVFMIRRAAYVAEIRSVALRARRVGWMALLLGMATFLWAALRGPGPGSAVAHWAMAAVGLGWALFFYVMVRRTEYVRAHPFDPER
ncbi:MAG TPA: hypothetical protein VIJ94_13930 [Caulobacteraceae bacterium]